ncbi:MAG: M42 family metallopeptidase [Coprococcus sp.]|nr:M42 family metallopeptidase [Coprococcus sp.]
MDSLKLIEALSNAHGASGFEDEVVKIAEQYASDENLGNTRHDCNLNVYIEPEKNTGKKPVVMLDAHSDEVCFMIQAIKPNGTLCFLPLGGWSAYSVPAHKVKVQTYDGEWVSGIVASTPVHFLSVDKRNSCPDFTDMVIDIGATSKEEVENVFHIHIGAPVVPDVTFEYNEKTDVMLGKAFDNRLGCAAVLESMKELQNETLDVDVVGVLSCQEEIGERGAFVTRDVVKPDIAICFEGCPADDTFQPDYAIQTAMKKGPMLRHYDRSMITNPRFQRFSLELAKELHIPAQESVRSGGGTNGGVIHISNGGVPVIVIGVPVRYIHSHHGFACTEDYHNSVRLAVEIVKRLNAELIQTF